MKRMVIILSLLIVGGMQLKARTCSNGMRKVCTQTTLFKMKNAPKSVVVWYERDGKSWKKCRCQLGGGVRRDVRTVSRPMIKVNGVVPMGPGPVVLPPSKELIGAAKKAAAGVNVILPRDFGKTYVKVDQKNYDACYFFPTSSKNVQKGFAACANSAYFGWEATVQCQAVTPLNLQMYTTGPNKGKPIYMHLGSYANPHYRPNGLMGGQSQRCNLYGKIEYRPVSLWDSFVREF